MASKKQSHEFEGNESGDAPLKKSLLEKVLTYTGGAILGGTIFLGTCVSYVKPDHFGIKQVEMSPFGLLGGKGIHSEVYDTGYHVVLPLFEKMHMLPKDKQVLYLNREKGLTAEEQKYSTEVAPANIQTSDGFYITLDASIIYKIKDPYKVITTLGAGRLFEQNGIIPKAEPALKEALGIMNPEDFYNSPLRVEKQETAKDLLNRLLEPKGVHVEHVLIRYPEYHKEVQARIEGRKLQDQLVYTNQSKAKERSAQAQFQKMTEEGLADKKVKEEEGKAYITMKNASRDLYTRKKKAEADKLVKLAEAKRTELVNEAYRGEGSEKLLGMEMAEVLKGVDNVIITTGKEQGFNPLDLESLMKMWNIKDGGKK